MKLSEELIWRGFTAETTIKDPAELDTRENKTFYFGADPSADSLTIGNLAALMMASCFVRHGYQPTLLAGGATGQIGDPKDTAERELKPLDEIDHNKACIKKQMQNIIGNAEMVDNYDWFKEIKFLDFLREIGKSFSMTQLMDRKFIQSRMGEGGSGISYAEFSYTLIQGYDFLHLYRTKGIQLQLCGADQYGNCATGISLIRKLENATADVWSTPLVIDPVTGRKFGKSEGNAVWLAAEDNGQGNYTSVFDFYQFWLNQPDESVEYLMKIYTTYDREQVEQILADHAKDPSQRIAQKALAKGVTEIVHGVENAELVEEMTAKLFSKTPEFTEDDAKKFSAFLPTIDGAEDLAGELVRIGFATSKKQARTFMDQGAIKQFGNLLKKGKNKFAIVK